MEKAPPRLGTQGDGDIEAHLVTLACGYPPEKAARWTLRLLAGRVVELGLLDSLSPTVMCERLKNALRLWWVKSWCLGTASARFAAKIEDVLSVYHRACDPVLSIVCLDEKSKELRSTPHGGLLPAASGRPRGLASA